AEGVDQTRGWFYSLMAEGTALFGKTPFLNVVVNGFTLDDNGVKLSKSKKNYDPPHEMIQQLGADAIRLNFFSTPIVSGEDTPITATTVRQYTQETLLPLWNSYKFLVTYANIHDWKPDQSLVYNLRKVENDDNQWDHIPFGDMENELDAWIIAKLQQTIKEVTDNLDNYDIPRATRKLTEFITELSKWYIRRSRDRFASAELRAMETLYYVLVEFCKLAAP